MNERLKSNFKPLGSVTIDEQLFPFRSGAPFRQYIPSKPAKYGLKIFWCCDSATAYPLLGKIYLEKQPGAARAKNVGEQTVVRLMQSSHLLNKGICVTTDNFFTSMRLDRLLSAHNTSLVGTVRRNKAFILDEFHPNKNDRKDMAQLGFRPEGLTLISYVTKPKKSVYLLSSKHDRAVFVGNKPEIIDYYNSTKGGIDTMDKLLGTYTCKRKTRRWTLAYNNSQYKHRNARRPFLEALLRELVMANVRRPESIC